MKKKTKGLAPYAMLFALAMLLVFSAFALADTSGEPTVYVDLHDPNETITLLAEAREDAKALGEYYLGAQFRLIAREGDFVHVAASDGYVQGYLPAENVAYEQLEAYPIAPYLEGYSVAPEGETTTALYETPDDTMAPIMLLEGGEWLMILGESAKEGWVHVQRMLPVVTEAKDAGPLSGYVKNDSIIRGLMMRDHNSSFVLPSDGEMAPLLGAPGEDARVLNYLYKGASISVSGASGDYLYVHISDFAQGAQIMGYMHRKDLVIADSNDSNDFIRAEISLASADEQAPLFKHPLSDQPEGHLSDGAFVRLFGETDGYALILVGYHQYFVEKESIRVIDTHKDTYWFPFEACEGFAMISLPDDLESLHVNTFCEEEPKSADDSWFELTDGDSVLLIRNLGEWAQIRHKYRDSVFIPSKYLGNIYRPSLPFEEQARISLSPGTYTVGEELSPDFYSFVVPWGGKGSIDIIGPDGAYERHYTPRPDSIFNMYLHEGAVITFEGGELMEADRGRYYPGEERFQSGEDFDGRFVVGVNIEEGTLQVRLRDDAKEGYYILSTIDQEASGEPPERVLLEPGVATYMIELDVGAILEIHNGMFWTNG